MKPPRDLWHWFRHDWTKWERISARVRSSWQGQPYGEWREAMIQKRVCRTCGIEELHNMEDDL